LAIPPQYHATVTLFMDGVVKNASLLSGAFVKKGELLAILENPEYIALQQSFIESHAQEEYLEAEFRRQEMLADGEAASKKTLQQSKADFLSMKSRREAAAAQLLLLGFDPVKILSEGILPQLELLSPIDGYVANVQVNTGKYVTAGDPVCDVIDKNRMLLKLTVYEKDINKLKMGDHLEFRVSGMETRTFYATIISLGQMVDNVSRSLEVYARVNVGGEQFRPGMYVSARVVK
ncbi:MAG: efflux RND transporter periplasmic adaptor subunit, partial [Bacteroidales bacterium]|nr:efflux RND transporter periplasmic adaptor subunit [Bacteroidales bacterium]